MSKDRAAPFSRKHRRYWIPVLGGMIIIGLINLVIGLISYSSVPPIGDQRIELHLPPPSVGPNAFLDSGSVPVDVER
ncbi:MAG TPA: hypothetical protein VGO00_23010 [Kofleriaceae bacterium]|nr:hypothetical protein [Kofleriaceae bacterium]